MSKLISEVDLKTYLNISGESEHKGLFDLLIKKYSAAIESYCKRTFASTTYTEKYDGDGEINLLLNNSPLISISSFVADTQTLTAASYILHKPEAEIVLINGVVFAKDFENISITYLAGYATIPEDVQLACLDLCAREFKTIDSGRIGLSSENMGSQSTSFITEKFTADIKALLDPYRKRIGI